MRNNGLGAEATTPGWGSVFQSILGTAVQITAGGYQSRIEEDRMKAERDLELARAAANNAQANAISAGAAMLKPRYLIGYGLGALGLLLLGGAWWMSKRRGGQRK